MVPPEWKIFVGGGNFEAIGSTFFHYFKELGQLKPDDKVLDIGCGQGRMILVVAGGGRFSLDHVARKKEKASLAPLKTIKNFLI